MIVPGSQSDILSSLTKRTKAILSCLKDFNGATQYEAVKEISRSEKLATSTIKYALKKLKEAGVIDYNGKIEFTQLGLEVMCYEFR